MASPSKKQKNTQKGETDMVGESAEFADHKSYRKSFRADKSYAERHNALMFVERGPFDWTKLHFAVWKDDLTAVKKHVEFHQTTKPEVLLQTGQWGETALQLALRMERSPAMIRELLRGEGAEAVNMNLEEYYFKDIDNEELWYGMCYYPIHEAVNYKNHEDAYQVTDMLIDKGADSAVTDYQDNTPITLAVWQGHIDVVRLLMDNGNVLTNEHEETLLIAAQREEEKYAIEILEFLFSEDKSYIYSKTPGSDDTLLHTFSREGKIELVKFMIKSGADVNAKNDDGMTPLDVAKQGVDSDDDDKEELAAKRTKIQDLLKKRTKKKN